VYIEILELDPHDSHSHPAYARFQSRRKRGANMQHNRLKGENRAMEKALLDHSWDSLKKIFKVRAMSVILHVNHSSLESMSPSRAIHRKSKYSPNAI